MRTPWMLIIGAVLLGVAAYAAELELQAQPGVFDPGKTGIVSASWQDKQGLADNDRMPFRASPEKGSS